MKLIKNVRCLAIVALTLVSMSAYADFKIGVVDRQVLGQDSLYAKSIHEKMKKEFGAREEALITKQKELMGKYEALERDKDVLSEAERSKREKEVNKLQGTLREEGEAFQREVMQRQEKEGAAFDKMINDVLTDIAKSEKLDLIIAQQMALYNGRKADYTYQALQALDKKFKESKKQ